MEGDKIERKGEFLTDVKYPGRRIIELKIGDIEQLVRSFKERIEEKFNNDIEDFDIQLSW